MMLARHGHTGLGILQVVHVSAEVVQLGLHELRRQVRRPGVFVVLEARGQAGHIGVGLDGLDDDVLERGEGGTELVADLLVAEQVVVVVVAAVVDLLEQVGDVVRLDDAAAAPQRNDLGEVEVPVVLLRGLLDQVQALREGQQEGCVSGHLEVLDKGGQRFVVWRFELDRTGLDAAAEAFVDGDAAGGVGGSEAEEVRRGNGRDRDVFVNAFLAGPGAGALGFVDVLDDFVFDGGENVPTFVVFGAADVSADGDEEVIELVIR